MKPGKLGLSLATAVAQLTTRNAWQLPSWWIVRPDGGYRC